MHRLNDSITFFVCVPCRLSEKDNACKDLESKVASLNEQLNNLTKDVESQRQKNDVSTTHARRVTLYVLGYVHYIALIDVCLCVCYVRYPLPSSRVTASSSSQISNSVQCRSNASLQKNCVIYLLRFLSTHVYTVAFCV